MKVVLTGGGSGGHIYPALAVADALEKLDPRVQIAYVGGSSGMESQVVPETGRLYVPVTSRKLTKLVSPSTFGVLLALLKGYREAVAFLKEWRPDAALGTGGYVAAATVLAASRRSIPTLILSPDAVAGRTNVLLSRWTKRICTWLGNNERFPASKVVHTGLPIRPDVVASTERAKGDRPDRENNDFTVLVIGGSQGAQALNEIVMDSVPRLPVGIKVLHQTGARNHESVLNAVGQGSDDRHKVVPFFKDHDLRQAYAAADILICRCGVGMLAEGTTNGLPLLMVPLPTAYADHQTHNARAIAAGGGGILLPQGSLSGERLASEICALRDDPSRLSSFEEASLSLGKPDAAQEVAALLKSIA